MARKTEPTASGRMPMMEQVMKCYRVVAQTERMKTGRPCANDGDAQTGRAV